MGEQYKMYLLEKEKMEVGSELLLALDRVQWQTIVNMVINIHVHVNRQFV